jgi:hypothetical protein
LPFGEARADVERPQLDGVDAEAGGQFGDAPRDGQEVVGVGVDGLDEEPPPRREARGRVGVEQHRRLHRPRRRPLGLLPGRGLFLQPEGRLGEAEGGADGPVDHPVEQPEQGRPRADAEPAQRVLGLVEAAGALDVDRPHQAVGALLAAAEVGAGGPLLEPQVHLRAEGEVVVGADDHPGAGVVLAGQPQERDGGAFEVVEVDHVERAVPPQEVGEDGLRRGGGGHVLAEGELAGGQDGGVD